MLGQLERMVGKVTKKLIHSVGLAEMEDKRREMGYIGVLEGYHWRVRWLGYNREDGFFWVCVYKRVESMVK